MSEDNTSGKDSDSSNVVPLFGNPNVQYTFDPADQYTFGIDPAATATTVPSITGSSIETYKPATAAELSDILDAIVGGAGNRGADGFDMTLSTNKSMYFGETGHSMLEIEACKVETTLFLMEDMSTSLQLNPLVTRDDALWDATLELQKCITKLLTRNKAILDSREENDEQ